MRLFRVALCLIALCSAEVAFSQNQVLYRPGGKATSPFSPAISAKIASTAQATNQNGMRCTLFNFEGVGDTSPVPDFQGISSPGWLGLIEDDFGGNGNFADEPSPVTIAFWLGGDPGSRDITFVNPVSKVGFFYTSAVGVEVDAFDASGAVLASVTGPANFLNGPPDDDTFTGWSPLEVKVDGNKIVKVRVTGNVNQTGIDDLQVCTSIGIHSVELTQAIQEWQELNDLKSSLQNSGEPPVPIIANKPAVLRVYMNKVEAVTDVRIDISGVTTQSKQITLQPQCTPEMQRRLTNGCQSLDFYFTPPSGSFDVTVNLFDSDGNMIETDDLPFKTRKANNLILKAVSVCDSKDASGVWQCAPANALSGHIGELSLIAPTSQVRVQVTNSVVRKDITTFDSSNGFQAWWVAVANDLNGLYGFFDSVADFFGGSHRTYYGMVRPILQGQTFGIQGLAHGIPSRAAASRTSVNLLGIEGADDVVAHETGHTLGGRHTNLQNPQTAAPPGCYGLAGDPNTDWPFADNLIQSTNRLEVGFNLSTRQPLIPETTFEIMSYCVPTWISPFSYRKFMGALGANAPSGAAPVSVAPVVGQFWTVSGQINGSSVQFDPLFQAQTSGLTDAGAGSHQIQVQDSTGAVLFTRFFTPETPETITTGPEVRGAPAFFELIPVTPGAAKIVVLDPNSVQIGALNLGGASPVVTITAPAAGSNVSGLQLISWTATNPNNGSLTSKVLYSPDKGQTFMQLGQVASATSLLVDFDTMPGAVNSALVRVLVSDGINTGTATSGAFTVPKKANVTGQILSPKMNSIYKKGDLVLFTASAYDIDDGMLDDTSITWTSNLAGVLGNGANLPVTTLQPGTHQITMTAKDSDNNSVTQSVAIRVAGQAPVMNLNVKALDKAPTTCVQVTINPAVVSGSVELTKIDYSLDGGTNFINVPLTNNPFTFIVPGSGFFHVIARAFDAAGQLASKDSEFFTAAPCQIRDTTPPVTTASVTPAPNANGWNNTDVTIALHATDSEPGGTGVRQIQFSTTGAQAGSGVVAGDSTAITISVEGTTVVTYFATDNAGNQETLHTLTIRLDKTPPVISGLPLPGSCILWPPNHKLVNVGTVSASDALSGLASFNLTARSSEPPDADPDIVITGSGLRARSVQLLAERLGSGSGRIYTLNATASDLADNTTNVTATCVVPHDQGH
jgi:hypothetical protein